MIIHDTDKNVKGTSTGVRTDVKVFDCTVRDGSLINSARFDDGFVQAVYKTCVAAGVDYMELGYKSSKRIFAPADFGAWKFCDEDDMRRIVNDNPTDLKLSVMADSHRTDYHTDILPKSESVLDIIRVACYIHQIPGALDLVKDAHDKGYETTLNLMAVSKVPDRDLAEGLEVIAESEVDVLYVVDSFGSLFFLSIRDLTLSYLDAVRESGTQIGVHCHNNQQLAFANTIEAMALGASYLDATICGMGRGAGNCALELLLGFLKNPKFKLRPVLKCIQETFVPIREKMTWGYDIPLMLTGQFNEHPRSAIKFIEEEKSTDYVSFYDSLEDF